MNTLLRGRFFIVMMLAFVLMAGSATASTLYVDSCQELTQADTTYILNDSITSTAGPAEYCFEMKRPGLTLDCNGHSITGMNEQSSVGVYTRWDNTVVQNCVISDFATGIKFDGAEYSTINNSTVTTSLWWGDLGYAIQLLDNADHNIITNSIAEATADGHGLYIFSGSDYNTISNVTASSASSLGLWVMGSNSNTIEDSSFSSDDGIAIYQNAASGNTYDNVEATTVNGIDIALWVSSTSDCNNELIDVTGTDGKPILLLNEPSETVSNVDASTIILCDADNSVVSDSQVSNGGIRLYYTDNAVLENIDAVSSATTLASIVGSTLYSGVELILSNYNDLTNVNGSSNLSSGVLLDDSKNNVLTDVKGVTEYSAAILLDSNSDSNILTGCEGVAQGTTVPSPSGMGLLLQQSSDNEITDSTFYSPVSDGFMITSDSNSNLISNSDITGKQSEGQFSFGALTMSYGAYNNTIANNEINGLDSGTAVALIAPWNGLEEYVRDNVFYNNTISNADTLLYIGEENSGNLFYWNTFENANMYIDDEAGNNTYNTTINGEGEGNIYQNVIDATVEVLGEVVSSYDDSLYIGSTGAGYPYDTTTSLGMVSSNVVDYAPLTPYSVSPAHLTVIKQVINDDGGTLEVADFTLYIDDTQVTSNESNEVLPGTRTVSEDAVNGYTGTISGDCASDGTVTLVSGDNKTCIITNDDEAATLTVIKQVINDNGGTLSVGDFTLYIDATPVTSGDSNELAPGTYTVSEDAVNGYTGTISGDCASNGTVTLAQGDDKTCTITNDDEAATLTVIKQVINDDGGEAVAADFTLNITANNPSMTSFPGDENGTVITLDAGSYAVVETLAEGYAVSYSDDCSGTIDIAQSKTCIVTNDDMQQCTLEPSADLNGDFTIDLGELLTYISEWQAGNVSLSNLLQAISFWQAGTGC